MNAIIVRSSFWKHPILQHLRLICPKEVMFRQSSTCMPDLAFPSYAHISFKILESCEISDSEVNFKEIVKCYRALVVIVAVGADEAEKYGKLLATIDDKVSGVICLGKTGFNATAAETIWKIASNALSVNRKIDRLVEEKRKQFVDPDIQGPRILDGLIQGTRERATLFKIMNTETGTIRNTLKKGIPELLDRDFYISQKQIV